MSLSCRLCEGPLRAFREAVCRFTKNGEKRRFDSPYLKIGLMTLGQFAVAGIACGLSKRSEDLFSPSMAD